MIKNETEVFLRLSSNIVGNSDDETNFPDRLLLDKFQIFEKLLQIIHQLILSYQKLSISKMIQSGGFLGRLLGLLLKT